MKEDRICIYKKCRLEAEEGLEYCKYHTRMIEMERNRPQWLNELIERIKKERYPED